MKTRKLISRFLLTVGRLLVVCLFLFQATGVAHADVPIIDGDGVIPFTGNDMDFGEVCQNSVTTKFVLIAIQRNGNGQVFANNALVAVSAEPTTGMFSASGSGTIQLPADWVAQKSDKTISDYTTLGVTITAGSATGAFTGTVTFNAAGPKDNGGTANRSGSLKVNARVKSCDTTPPTINVPVVNPIEAASAAGATVIFEVSADDTNPPHPTVTCSPASGSTFPLGTTEVTCSATDAAGNTGSKTFIITVQDTTPPAFSPVSSVTAEAAGTEGAVVKYDAPTATDLVDGRISSVTCSPASGDTYAIGSTTVTCTAADSRGNSGHVDFNILVEDTTSPVLSLPVAIEKEADSPAGAAVDYSDKVSASDLVDGVITPSCQPPSGSTFSLGSTPVGCSATDDHGNTASGSFPVNVVDTTAPALTLPDSFSAEAKGPNGAVVDFTATAFDKVDRATEVSCSPASGATFGLGETTVICSSTDQHSNKSEGSFVVTVVDTTAPELTVPADQKLEATGPNGSVATFSPSASDVVDTNPTVSCGFNSGDTFPLGKTTVNCTATDTAGNVAKGAFVIEVVDTTAPTLHLPNPISQEATSAAGTVVKYTATADDLVDGAVAPICTPASDSTFPLGISIVACTATDKAGNAKSGTFSINVVDTTPPVLTLPADITKEASGPKGAAVNYDAPTATDLVDGATSVSCDLASGSTFGLGNTTVTCSSTDTHGNKAESSFKVTVRDTTPPALDLPAPITAEATSPAGATVTYGATATDLVDGSVLVSCDPASGSTFALGTKAVGCEATDSHNNTAKGSFVVTVQDTIAPAVKCSEPNRSWSGSDITVECTASDSGSGLASASDASFTLTTSVADGIETDKAVTDSLDVKDVVGNSTLTGPFEGLMVDKAAPTYTCGAADSTWHNTDVSIACTAQDGGSGLATPAEFSLSTHVSDGEELANAVTDGTLVSDKVGHEVTVAPISGNMIDKKAPQLVSCDQPDGLWHADNVTLNCTYSDGGSGPATQTVSLSTTVAAGEETSSAKASTTQQAKDKVGNAAPVPDPISGNWIDRKAPVITIETPAGEYLLNQSVTVKFSCADGGSGVETCQGTQNNGTALNTSTVGPHSFTVTSTDNLGNASTQTVTYTVKYVADDKTLCLGQAGHQVLQPINSDGSSVFKKGSTVPVKFRVCDANGNSVSTAGIVKGFTFYYVSASGAEMVNEASISTTPDTTFRWSASDQQWIYNMSTKDARFSSTSGSKYFFTITLDDGSKITFYMSVK